MNFPHVQYTSEDGRLLVTRWEHQQLMQAFSNTKASQSSAAAAFLHIPGHISTHKAEVPERSCAMENHTAELVARAGDGDDGLSYCIAQLEHV